MVRKGSTSDGYFELFYRDGWAHLTVHPPDAHGQPVYHDDIRNRMRVLGVPHVDPGRLRQIAEDATGHPVKLVEWKEGERLASRVTVAVAEDEMAATVTVTAPLKGAAPPTRETIRGALREAGVVFGIDGDALRSLLEEERYNEAVTVARGRPAVDAESARIEYHFNTNRGKPYLELDFGRIDLRELNFIENKYEGDLLATLVPPVSPRDGRTVTGKSVPAQTATREVHLQAGDNTTLSDDGATLYAAMDGNAKISRGRVVIEPVVHVKNVNYETGNIDFDGSVVVEKDIADRFTVKAGGDIQVGGGVGRATIMAGGNVLLKRGINGGGEGRIECGGNLFAKFVESSTVLSKANVLVEEAILHSRVSAWKHCLLNGRRAEVIGSAVIVGGSLWCKKLGSVAEAELHVAVGISPDFVLEFRRTRELLASREERLAAVQQQLEQIERAFDEGHTAEKLRRAQEQLATEATTVNQEVRELRRLFHDMRDRMEASRKSLVVVEDSVYKGAVITFGMAEYRAPDRGTRKTIFKFDGRAIQEVGYNPADAPTIHFDEGDEETKLDRGRDSVSDDDQDPGAETPPPGTTANGG
ncbi:MAG: FapA family protein [Spirochaetaceae bacterium]